MSEENTMQNQKKEAISVITAYNNVPYFLIEDDLKEMGMENYITETDELMDYYKSYYNGKDFNTEGSHGDYIPSDLDYMKATTILDKEARFLFANPPTFNLNIEDVDIKNQKQNTILQDYLDKVLEKNNFASQISKAVKDCFIAKRIAIVLNFNEETGISVVFLNSLEFIYQYSHANPEELSKFICFHCTNTADNKAEQIWFKKTYYLNNNAVYFSEAYYDGLGNLLDEYPVIEDEKTLFNKIPAVVILNDGLIGDKKGQSELRKLLSSDEFYSKLANVDMDAERKSMNPIAYAIDASQESTSNLSTGPGAFWDIQTDPDKPEENRGQAQVGMLEPSMNYSNALKMTLDRVENNMYAMVDVPNINSEQLAGVITSGKTISALYWGLTVRCDEKMLVWRPALRSIAELIIEGGKLYSNCISQYTQETLPELEYEILVENNYPLPQDEQEEKNQDITEVDANLMSRKAYMKKWRNLSDEEADEELKQIKREMDLLDNSQVPFESEDMDLYDEDDEDGMADLLETSGDLEEDDDSDIDSQIDAFLAEIGV